MITLLHYGFHNMPSKASILTKALLNTSKEMGISIAHLEKIIDRDNSAFKHADINPQSKIESG